MSAMSIVSDVSGSAKVIMMGLRQIVKIVRAVR